MTVTPDLDTRFRDAALARGPRRRPLRRRRRRRSATCCSRRRRAASAASRTPSRAGRVARRAFGVRVLRAPLDDVRRELDEYFDGRRRDFDLPLDLRVAPFHEAVLHELARVPVRPARHLRPPRREGRPPDGGPRGRHGDEPQPDPDRAAVPPDRRRERLAHRLRRRPAREARAARARGRDARDRLSRRRRRSARAACRATPRARARRARRRRVSRASSLTGVSPGARRRPGSSWFSGSSARGR